MIDSLFTALSFTVADAGRATVVSLDGELDVYTTPKLKTVVVRLLGEGRALLVLDMSGLTFCDANGLGALLGCRRQVREHGGYLRLVRVGEQMAKLLRLTGLERVLPAYPSPPGSVLAEILESVNPRPRYQ